MWDLLCCFSILLIPVGLWLMITGVVRLVRFVSGWDGNVRRRTWHTAPGEVIAADVWGPVLSLDPGFTVVIRYKYSVSGCLYTGSRIRKGRLTGYRREMMHLVENVYPVGQSVTVHYSPRQPQRSLLELTYHAPSDLMRLGLRGVFYLAMGILLSVVIPFFWLYLTALALMD